MRLSKPDQYKSVTLSDGTIAKVREPRGRDLIRAQDVAGESDNKFKFTCAMLSMVTLLNGEPCVFEDIMDLSAKDINLLSQEAAGDFLQSIEPSSPSLSNGASGSQNSTR